MGMDTRVFISKLNFSYNKYSVDKVWTEIYCHFYLEEYLNLLAEFLMGTPHLVWS